MRPAPLAAALRRRCAAGRAARPRRCCAVPAGGWGALTMTTSDDPLNHREGGPYQEDKMPAMAFEWSDQGFNEGRDANLQRVAEHEAEFTRQLEGCGGWAVRMDGEVLHRALDMGVVYIKNYLLDKADAIYAKVLPLCRERGFPWVVRALQDTATLRFKQHRQKECASLLEELEAISPPHPATYENLGTVYNSLRMPDKAYRMFEMKILLQGGEYEGADYVSMGLVKKHVGRHQEALEMFEKALQICLEEEPDMPVSQGKLHGTVADARTQVGDLAGAEEQHQLAYDKFKTAIGHESPLFGGAAWKLAKCLVDRGKLEQGAEVYLEALHTHAVQDAPHPTPLMEIMDDVLVLHTQKLQGGAAALARYLPKVEHALQNLQSRGMGDDANAGIVHHRAGEMYLWAGGEGNRSRARQHFERAEELLDTVPIEEYDLSALRAVLAQERACAEGDPGATLPPLFCVLFPPKVDPTPEELESKRKAAEDMERQDRRRQKEQESEERRRRNSVRVPATRRAPAPTPAPPPPAAGGQRAEAVLDFRI
eukprot:TRINITY_DN22637_c0_g1_i1.p1 TRINITY_DN22637_c0_g1~~TRINITY_DN22637_c0_g1_i1.p1  ORF type:complete len:562 (+),score=184.34 TRINITY_DN22637_c0_g1_i1:70-1686(+)